MSSPRRSEGSGEKRRASKNWIISNFLITIYVIFSVRDIPKAIHTWLYKPTEAGRELLNILFLCFERARSFSNRTSILDNNKLKTVENYLSYFTSAPGWLWNEMGIKKRLRRPRVGWVRWYDDVVCWFVIFWVEIQMVWLKIACECVRVENYHRECIASQKTRASDHTIISLITSADMCCKYFYSASRWMVSFTFPSEHLSGLELKLSDVTIVFVWI